MGKETKESVKKAYAKKVDKKPKYRYSLGADLLNTVVGGGEGLGYPSGKIVNIVGDKSSGKTFLACELIAHSYHRDKTISWVYDDCESGFSFDTKKLYGVEVMPLEESKRIRSKTVEELYCNIRQYIEGLEEGEKGIYVVDSLDGLSSDELNKRSDERFAKFQKDEEYKKGSMQMGKAKFLSQEFFRPIAEMIERTDCLLVIISQVRCNVDPFSFEKFTRAGGKALDFFCHTVLWLAQLSKITKRERAIGALVKAKATKSKTPRPYRECIFSFLFSYGIDNVGTNVDFLFDMLTEKGKHKTKETVVWEGIPITVTALKEFAEKREFDVKNLKRDPMVRALEDKFPEEFDKVFGVPMTRAQLIDYVEENNLQKELSRRTLVKWEEIEADILPKRGVRQWV